MKYRRTCFSLALLLYFLLSSNKSYTQENAISHSTTCVGDIILFSSFLFDNLSYGVDQVTWTFGDPASGALNTSVNPYNFTGRHVFTNTGTYYIQLHIDGFIGKFDLFDTITIVNAVPYNFGPDIFLCQGDTTFLVAPPVPGATYLWNDKLQTTADTLIVYESNTYTVKINGCIVPDTIGIFFSNKPDLNLGKDHIMCAGEDLLLSGANQNGIYQWFYNGTEQPETSSQLQTTTPGGQYMLVLTVPGCGIYTDTVNITYSSHPAPPFSLGSDTLLCPKQVYTLNAQVANATAYGWNTGSTQPSIDISTAGTYYAFVTVDNTCEVTDSINIFYRGNNILNLRDTTMCKGETIILSADFGVGSYNWTAIPAVRDGQDVTDQATFYVYTPGTFMVKAQVGECTYYDTAVVTYRDTLNIQLQPRRDTMLCNGEPWILFVSGNADVYTWQDGTTGTSYAVQSAGTYYATATNVCGTDTTARVTIRFMQCNCDLLLPTAFTPNGDGRNDVFRPLRYCDMEGYSSSIFNRFGECVFNSRNPAEGWDGTYKKQPQIPGTYVWITSYANTNDHKRREKKGTVVLIR